MTHALIHVKNVHIHLPQPKATDLRGGIPLAAFASAFAKATPPTKTQAPAICKPWPGVDGVYVGVSRGVDGAPDTHLVLLNARPTADLAHKDAMEWATSQAPGSRAPTSAESFLICANARDQVDRTKGHWTSTLFGDSDAWVQYFLHGNQYNASLSAERAVRAVCLIPVL